MDVHYADIGLILFLLVFIIRGYSSGLVLSVINVFIFLFSLFLSVLYKAEFAQVLGQILPIPEESLQFFSFILLFLTISIVLGILSKVAKVFNKIPLLGNLNQALGALVGLFKGIVITSLLLLLLNNQFAEEKFNVYLKSGVLHSYFIEIAPSVYNSILELVPVGESFYDEFNQSIKTEVDKHIKST